VKARQGKGEGGLARACLQMRGEMAEGEMASRGVRRGARGFLSAGGGLGVLWSRPSRIGRWCGAF
jgi:hypothetical protein